MRPVKKASTDQSIVIRIIDSTNGTPETEVVYDTAGINLWYRREGATKTSITEAPLAALNTAHSDGGIIHIGDGYYRLDLPDAAVETGCNGVMVGGTVTGMVVIGTYVPLVSYDPYDTVRLGLTALPNAAADDAGGLPISIAGSLDIDAIKTKTDSLTFTVAGDVDVNVQTWKGSAAADLSSLAQASVCSETRLSELDAGTAGKMANQVDVIQTDTTTDIPSAITALNDITVADIIAGIADGTYDLQEMLRIMFAALAGKSAGGGTATITFRDAADSKNRISATVDANGNRTAITVIGD